MSEAIRVIEAVVTRSRRGGKQVPPELQARCDERRRLLARLAADHGLVHVPPGSGDGQAREWGKVQVTGMKRDPVRISYARQGEVAYLVGFSLEHPRVEQISAEQAKLEHIGNCRGGLDLTDEGLEPVLEAAVKYLASRKR